MTEEAIFNYLEKHQNGKWKSFQTSIDSIEWWDEVDPPEKNIIEEGVKVEQKIIDDTKYQRDRAKAYPELKEQLDLLWHAIDGGKFNVKSKDTDFYKKLKAVKDANPKPE